MKKLRFLGLFPLLLMAFLLWLAVSWFATDVFLSFRVKAHIQEEISGVEKQTIRVAEGLSNKLSDIHGVLTLVARDADVLRALSRFQSDVRPSSLPINQRKSIWSEDAQLKKVDDYLKLVNTEMKDDVVYLINTAGDCVAASNMEKPESFVGTNYLSREYFKEAMKGRRGYQYAMGKVSNIPGLFFSVPVVDEGRLVGVLVAKRTLHSLMRPISHANTFIVDQFGVIILASEKRYEMRSLPGASVAALSREARLERYKREDFPVLTVSPWRDRWGSISAPI